MTTAREWLARRKRGADAMAAETTDLENGTMMETQGATSQLGAPQVPADLAGRPVVALDVRAELRAGREPFSRIMAGIEQLPAGGVLGVRAIFEPAPLYAVLRRRGFEHTTEQLADDDWQVWFHAPLSSASSPSAQIAAPALAAPTEVSDASRGGDDGVVVLDVRGLEPPEPMVRTLAALETLPAGGTLVQVNVRVPQFLLPQLEQRGYTWDVREQAQDLVRVFIRRAR